MTELPLHELFLRFGLAAALGFLIGLERGKGAHENVHTGSRDFVLFALIGAISAFSAELLANDWLIALAFAGFLILLTSGYWADRRQAHDGDIGITSEIAAVLTFFLGILAVKGSITLAIALTILTLAVLSQKGMIRQFSASVQRYELDATLKLLVITFIILPILPNQTLDSYLTVPLGQVAGQLQSNGRVAIDTKPGLDFEVDQQIGIYDDQRRNLGTLQVTEVGDDKLVAGYQGDFPGLLKDGNTLRMALDIPVVDTMMAAIRPYKVWLIVVLVSFISFIGYVLIKVIGPRAGIGLTGIIGGLASSTVTTLSFAKRSLEAPDWNRNFAVAVILASSVMFPRLLLEIFVVNAALAKNMMVPLGVMGLTGLVVAAFYQLRSGSEHSAAGELKLANPFSLKSAITFGLIFASILMLTRLAITYLGDAWLPLIALVSGLTDADAIAFSLSDAEHSGLISLDWASFNVVLGALSNTFMKLFLVLTLGHRGLFRQLLVAFLIIGGVGIVTMFLYYDLPTVGF